jgi:DNA-binding SARP family transcriptional activator
LREKYRRPQKVDALTDLRIELLGGFHVMVGARAVSDDAWRRRKPAALLKLLAHAPGHRLHHEQVMDGLWPELDPPAAAANLRKALHQARGALGGGEGGLLVTSRGEFLCLPPRPAVCAKGPVIVL